jgi:hypothetical protein
MLDLWELIAVLLFFSDLRPAAGQDSTACGLEQVVDGLVCRSNRKHRYFVGLRLWAMAHNRQVPQLGHFWCPT